MDRYQNYEDTTESNNYDRRPPNPYLNPYKDYSAGYPYNAPAPGPAANGGEPPYNYAGQPVSNPYYPASGQTYPEYYPYNYFQPATETKVDPLTERQRVLLGEQLNGRPVWTYVFLVIIGLAFLGQMATGGSVEGTRLDPLIEQGALIKSEVVRGEWWRLVTPIFLHFGLMHIMFNSIALYALGVQLEQLMGQARFVAIFFLSGLGGSVLVLLLQNERTVTVGASGAVFGLMGALIGYFYRNRNVMGAWGAANLKNLLITAGINFAFTLAVPGISLFGHLGGALAGLALGYLLSPLQVRRTIGPGAQSAATRLQDFALAWWPVAAMLALQAVLLYLALQNSQPAFRLR